MRPLLELALCGPLLLLAWSASAQPAAAQQRAARTFEAELETVPYHVSSEPNVSVHVPEGFDPSGPLHLVIYVHGLRGCLPVLMGQGEARCAASDRPQLGWDLGAHHDAAKTNSVFVVPRLGYGKRNGQPGTFGKAGGFRAFLEDLLTGPLSEQLDQRYTTKSIASITLVAHSAGYETALAILERGDMGSRVRAVVLLDALYAFEERYARYALAHADDGFRLIAIHLRGGRPAREGHKLQQRLVRALGRERVATASASELRAALASHPFVIAEGRGPHPRVPQQHMAEVLSALGLPAR